MKKILYISNVEVPYRTEFFNQISEKVDLTVLYERQKSSNRDSKWCSSVSSKYTIKYLKGIKMFNECAFDFRIIKHVFSKKYDDIIIGCYNSPSQIFAILLMRLFRKKYILNVDGEYFLEGKSIKNRLKKFLIKGAHKYIVAGEASTKEINKLISKNNVYCYHFSSLKESDVKENALNKNINKNGYILVVGQYFDYKGLDIALECAKLDDNIKYKFVGAGKRNSLLEEKIKGMKLNNVETIPFLQKKDLFNEYQQCKCLLLPSNKECWGLVINEAASFGCPIISTSGSGAAIEFIEKKWLVEPYDYNSMYEKIKLLDNEKYNKERLIKKSQFYTIEQNVIETIDMLNDNKK